MAFQEPGADFVLPRLRGSLLSVVNYQEVLEKMQERQISTENALSSIQGMRILIVSGPFWGMDDAFKRLVKSVLMPG
jgi:PIN domain nuclease of toxin-antitoxin system